MANEQRVGDSRRLRYARTRSFADRIFFQRLAIAMRERRGVNRTVTRRSVNRRTVLITVRSGLSSVN